MTSVVKTSVTANKAGLVAGQTIDVPDVENPIDDLITNDRQGYVAVTAADLNVKNLDDALTVSAGLLKSVTSPGGDEALNLALAAGLETFRSSYLDGSGKVALTGLQQGGATPSQVLTWSGSAWGPAAAGGGGAAPIDITVTAGENLAERDIVYIDVASEEAFKLDIDAVGAIKAGRIRGIVNEGGGITTSSTGSVRISGEVSGFTGLTAWADVFASTTAGAYTQTKPTLTAGGGQVAIARMGFATSTVAMMVWPAPIEFMKRESLADAASLTIDHYSDLLAWQRRTRAYVSSTEDGPVLTEYDEANQDYDVWLRNAGGAGNTVDVNATGNAKTVGTIASTTQRQSQSFQITAGRLSQFKFTLSNNIGSPTGTITWEIRDNNVNEPGNLLLTNEISPVASSENTVDIDNGIFLASSTTYWLVLWATDVGSFGPDDRWRWDATSPSVYANGNRAASTDGGASWSVDTGSDLNFEITTIAETVKDKLAQSFQIPSTNTVNKVQLYLKKIGSPTGTMTCRIETDSAGDPSGVLADVNATVTVLENTLSTSYDWIDFDFAVDFSLTGSTTYWIVLSTDRSASAVNYVAWGADQSTPGYANGEMKSEVSASWGAESKDAIFGVFPIDTAFNEMAVMGRWSGGTRDVAMRTDDGTGSDPNTKTTFKNTSGGPLDLTCIVELE